jgi:tetratricopeptide (TPR) repeat protein
MLQLFRFSLLCACLGFFSCESTTDNTANTAVSHLDPEVSRFNALIAKAPKNDSLYFRRGLTLLQLEAYDEALADANKAIQLDSMEPAYYDLMADVLISYRRPNDSRRAIEVMTDASRRFPEDAATWLHLAELHLIVKQHDQSLRCLDHVLQRDNANADAYFLTGRVALDKGDTIRAVRSLQKSVQLDADNPPAWVMLGRLASKNGDDRAIQYFDNALRLDSTNVSFQEFKAIHFVQKGQYDKAFRLYRDIVVKHPDYSNAYYDMGQMYLDLDSLDQAWRHFDLAIKTDQLFVNAYYYRGVASEAKGDMKAAIADYAQANKMSPNLPEPRAALERLNQL